MVRRITVSLEEKLEEQIRSIQVEVMKETNRSVSFSKVLNQLKEGFKKHNPIIEFRVN